MTNGNSKSKFSKLIAVRFTEEELDRLQEAAEDEGVGASTLVRIIVNLALRPTNARPRKMTSDEFHKVMAETMKRLDKTRVDDLLKNISIGNPEDPALLVWAGETNKWQAFTSHFLNAFLASLGIEVNIPENKEIETGASDGGITSSEKPAVGVKVKKHYVLSEKGDEARI
jgi:hypothetical protein